jgi:archaeal type IV pilus assembly protein PilA
VILLVEGKKCRAIGQDCQAVSEVIGQLLMIGIVVLAFSTIALTVFSEGGVVKPPHTPCTSLREKINTSSNTIKIFHTGGEAIDLNEIKIVISVNGIQTEFDKSKFKVTKCNSSSPSNVFMLGDYIVIDTMNPVIKESDSIEMFFVHTPSKQVIQRAVIQ